MLRFEKPEYKIKEYQESNHYGKFELEPLGSRRCNSDCISS